MNYNYMKYFWSFLSGFALPILAIIFASVTMYGGLALFTLGPWLLVLNLLVIVLLHFTLKTKYSFWSGFAGLVFPILALIICSVVVNNL